MICKITNREGFSVAFAEVMSMDIPVITSRISPLTELAVDRVTGFLVKGAMMRFLPKQPRNCLTIAVGVKLWAEFSREHMIKHFSQLRMCRGYEKIFSDISQKGGHHYVLN